MTILRYSQNYFIEVNKMFIDERRPLSDLNECKAKFDELQITTPLDQGDAFIHL
jgi:hypothetical protein